MFSRELYCIDLGSAEWPHVRWTLLSYMRLPREQQMYIVCTIINEMNETKS